MPENIQFDTARAKRTAIPEAIFCEGKSDELLFALFRDFSHFDSDPVLFTRIPDGLFARLDPATADVYRASYDPLARAAFNRSVSKAIGGSVAIVSAGSSDASVVREAAKTLEFMNIDYEIFEDCGVAGLWRLQQALVRIVRHQVVIVAAGMEAALVSVLAGLITQPIIGVPVSTGYGVCEGGKTALRSILASCAPGVAAVNIDNGFGAACFAYKILYSASSIRA